MDSDKSDPQSETMAASGPRLELLSTVSHELRSPLNVIIGYGEMLRDGSLGPLTEEQADALKRIGNSANLLLERLDAVLEFSSLQVGDVEMSIDAVPATEVLAVVSESMAAAAEAKVAAVTLEIACDPELPDLRVDAERLAMALQQIVANALKFTDAGRVGVSASRSGAGVEFAVTDTGSGIPADKLETIFAPFEKVSRSKTKGFRDLGLGLYIARRYVEMMGGRIMVSSEVGSGSSFRVWVPAA